MSSLTVRKLDERLKKRLRVRAAKHGRSMEDEVRAILRGATGEGEPDELGTPVHEPAARPSGAGLERPADTSTVATAQRASRILLIIAGGIAAYKSLDLVRRLQE